VQRRKLLHQRVLGGPDLVRKRKACDLHARKQRLLRLWSGGRLHVSPAMPRLGTGRLL
jgi:hypothetical protein